MLVRCLYASRISTPHAASALDEILEQSRKNNPKHGITGLLCHTHDSFVQVVEGGREPISDLLRSIYRDGRHQQMTILMFEEIAERRFGNWTMGRVNVESINAAVLLKYCEKTALDPFTCSSHAMMSLLMDLSATGSIVNRGAT
jgi:hypothetical protein